MDRVWGSTEDMAAWKSFAAFIYDIIIYHQICKKNILLLLYHIIPYYIVVPEATLFISFWRMIRQVHDLQVLRLWLPIQQDVVVPSLTAL